MSDDTKAPRGKRTDSVSEKVKAVQHHEVTAVPPGVKINSKAAKVLWEQYTNTRQDWTESHLLTVGKLVHLEILIRDQSKMLAGEDMIIQTRLGEIKENPRLQALDRLVKQQATLIRLIGLNVNNDESAKLNRRPKKNADDGPSKGSENTKDRLRGKLLAMPGGRRD